MKYQNIFKRQTKLTLYIVICLLLLEVFLPMLYFYK